MPRRPGAVRSGRSVCSEGSVRSGRVTSAGDSVRVGGLASGRDLSGRVVRSSTGPGEDGVSDRSRRPCGTSLLLPGRGGRVTAPVDRASLGPALSGCAGLSSLPFSTRVRCSSRSNATPGVRCIAPVGLSPDWRAGVTRAGRATVRSRPSGRSPVICAGRTGKSPLTGSAVSIRRANTSVAGWSLRFSPPNSLADTPVTARS